MTTIAVRHDVAGHMRFARKALKRVRESDMSLSYRLSWAMALGSQLSHAFECVPNDLENNPTKQQVARIIDTFYHRIALVWR